MLQQTRVTTAIPYFTRFLQAFPTIQHLAKAKEEDVLKLWEGLGYYNRARLLCVAAKHIVTHFGGTLPTTVEELRTLPGFGPYTAGAVASIAFGQPVLALDGNARRVFSRLLATSSMDPRKIHVLLDVQRPSDFNQAIMELGSLICLAKVPLCGDCPLSSHCQALKRNCVQKYPKRSCRKKPQHIEALSFVIRWRNQLFVRQRPLKGRWAGLWEVPTLESFSKMSKNQAMHALKKCHGISPRSTQKMGSFVHHLTHQTIHVEVHKGLIQSCRQARNGEWINDNEIFTKPFSRLQQKVLDLAL